MLICQSLHGVRACSYVGLPLGIAISLLLKRWYGARLPAIRWLLIFLIGKRARRRLDPSL